MEQRVEREREKQEAIAKEMDVDMQDIQESTARINLEPKQLFRKDGNMDINGFLSKEAFFHDVDVYCHLEEYPNFMGATYQPSHTRKSLTGELAALMLKTLVLIIGFCHTFGRLYSTSTWISQPVSYL